MSRKCYPVKVEIKTKPYMEDDVYMVVADLGPTPQGKFEDIHDHLLQAASEPEIELLFKAWGWATNMDDETGVVTFRGTWRDFTVLEQDTKLFEAIAPFVEPGSRYVWAPGPHRYHWDMRGWDFTGEQVVQRQVDAGLDLPWVVIDTTVHD